MIVYVVVLVTDSGRQGSTHNIGVSVPAVYADEQDAKDLVANLPKGMASYSPQKVK